MTRLQFHQYGIHQYPCGVYGETKKKQLMHAPKYIRKFNLVLLFVCAPWRFVPIFDGRFVCMHCPHEYTTHMYMRASVCIHLCDELLAAVLFLLFWWRFSYVHFIHFNMPWTWAHNATTSKYMKYSNKKKKKKQQHRNNNAERYNINKQGTLWLKPDTFVCNDLVCNALIYMLSIRCICPSFRV